MASAMASRDYRDRVNHYNERNAQTLRAIQQLMSGKKWSSDTLDAIADLLNKNGYPINDVER